jgi:hypothetical protein
MLQCSIGRTVLTAPDETSSNVRKAGRTIGPAERVYQNGKLPPAIAASSSAPPTIALLRPLGAARAISAG